MKRFEDDNEDSQGGSGSSGGQGGAIQFHDFVFPAERQLSAGEEKQILAEHKEKNLALVEEQKDEVQKRLDKESSKGLSQQQGYGAEAGLQAEFDPHPILSQSPEWDGVDPQMNSDPLKNENKSDKRKELVLQNQLKLGLQHQPGFVPPIPRPGGG